MAIDLAKIYSKRFSETGVDKKNRVWKVLCENFFQQFVDENATVMDLACGYGEFINNIRAGKKIAVDLNPDASRYLSQEVSFINQQADNISRVKTGSVDVVFTSNFFEHLASKEQLIQVIEEINRCLSAGGIFIVMGPNIKYTYDVYWDFFDHLLPLSELAAQEGLEIGGFDCERVIDRFLPYTMKNKTPTNDILIKTYLKLPVAWKFMGKQFLIVARKK